MDREMTYSRPDGTYVKPSPRSLTGTLSRQLGRSKWLKEHFLASTTSKPQTTAGGQIWLANFRDRLNKNWVDSPAEGLFDLAVGYPLEELRRKSKFDYLRLLSKSGQEEDDYRKRAHFYLLLVQHFMGVPWSRELKAIYSTEKVKWRKVRTDKGDKLTGAALVEFKMRLEGHSLMVPALTTTPVEDDD